MGIQYNSPDELTFAPVVPESLKAKRRIEGFRYRDAVLDVTVKGYGDIIKSFSIDGKKKNEHVFPADLAGHHKVEITLANAFENDMKIAQVGDVRTPMVPFFRISGSKGRQKLRWYAVEGALRYDIYAGGKKVLETTANDCRVGADWRGDLQLVVIAKDGTESFPTEPININEKVKGAFEPKMLLKENGEEFELEIEVPYDGDWALTWNYVNARGSIYSELTCGIRMLYVNGEKVGLNIFPNRYHASGMAQAYLTDGWDMWGWTSPEKLTLKAGENVLILKIESDSDNMSRDVNDFMLKGYSLTKY
jgi:hypothetical protein